MDAVICIAKDVDALRAMEHEEAFVQVVQLSLWGNQADLCLQVEQGNVDGRIVVNHTERVWEVVRGLQGGVVHIVLDNAGFELFNDLVLVDWLLSSGYAQHVRLHVKPFAWYVSDATQADIAWLVDVCMQSPAEELRALAERWKQYLQHDRMLVETHWFWNTAWAYHHIHEQAPDLWTTLSQADLVVVKGDLNYRKLVYDCQWDPETTTFNEAIGPMWKDVPLVSLRTCKSDVVVGLQVDQVAHLDALDKDWLVNGQWAVIQSNL
jgi:hypothetical protein